MSQKSHQQRLSKDEPAPAKRPLERRRDWILALLGVVVLGIGGGYLLEGRLVLWTFLVPLGVFLVAVFQHYRRGPFMSSGNRPEGNE
jgi:hypothetical protein